jgi:hypothetical protein
MEVICPAHTAHAGVALYERIREENRRKNLVWTMIQGLDPTCDHATYGWQFDAERCLLVTLPSLTPAQRLQLQGGADLQFGPDRIHVL